MTGAKEAEEQGGAEAARLRVERRARRYAARGPYRLNPDPATVEHVLVGLARNLVRYGRAYCPCREVSGDPARDRANLCPCPQHHEDIARDGVCECGIFVRAEKAIAPNGEDASTDKEER